MNVRNYYNRYWTDDGYNPVGGPYPELERLMRAAGIGPNTQCLDVGCGDGGTAGNWVLDAGASYVGVDVSATGVQAAHRRGLEAALIDDPAHLAFPDNHFDHALCLEVFEHLFAPHEAASEIWRVLKPGGMLVATVPNIGYWRRRTDLMFFGRFNPGGDDRSSAQPCRDPHVRFFSHSALTRMLESTGFSVGESGAVLGALLDDIPMVRRISSGRRGGQIYRRLEETMPSLFGLRLFALAKKKA